MKLNAIPLSIDKGVPLKAVTFTFTYKEKIDTSTLEIDGKSYLEAFAIASSTYSQEQIEKYLSEEQVHASNLAPTLHLLCNLESIQKDSNGLYHYTCIPIHYLKLQPDQPFRKGLIQYKIFELKSKYPKRFNIEEIKDLFSFILENTSYFSLELQENILLAESIEEILNALALAIYSVPIQLYAFQQNDSEKKRFKDVLDNLFKDSGIVPVSFETYEREPPPKKEYSEKDIFTMFVKEFSKQVISDQQSQESPPDLEADIEAETTNMPTVVKEKYIKEKTRLKRLPTASLEYQTQLDYIELLLEMPWGQYSNTKVPLKEIEAQLDRTHKGLKDVKEDIISHFALEQHLESPTGSVLCFLGPPGTGKTSIVKSIAKSTGRKIIKIALGGMNDEAEFRGHRRTYVSSKPGRIVSSIKDSKTLNPIILLDEIDKITTSDRSNPLAALLEILDPEQNNEFIDRYLEIPLDLSKVLFIATANYKEKIPKPLLDRLDIINFKEYTPVQKLQILKEHTIPVLKKEFNINHFDIVYEDDFFDSIKIFSNRDMEKIMRSIFRKFIYSYISNEETKFTVTKELIKKETTPTIGFNHENNNKKT